MIDIETIKTIATEDWDINWSSKTVLELITRLAQQEEQIAGLVATNATLDAEWKNTTADKFAEMAESILLKDEALAHVVGMNQEDIKQMVERLREWSANLQPNGPIRHEAADMLESLNTESEDKSVILSDYKARLHRMDDQLADCQRELEAERERRFEGNRISSEEHAAELAALKAAVAAKLHKQILEEVCYKMASGSPNRARIHTVIKEWI